MKAGFFLFAFIVAISSGSLEAIIGLMLIAWILSPLLTER